MKLCKECLASLDAEIASLSADLTVLEKLRNQYQKERDELRTRDESDGMAPASSDEITNAEIEELAGISSTSGTFAIYRGSSRASEELIKKGQKP